MRDIIPPLRFVISAALVSVLGMATASAASPEAPPPPAAGASGGIPGLTREIVTLRRQLTKLSEQIDEAETELRATRRQVRRELETSPEIEQARLELRDARHDYYTARDAVMKTLQENETYTATQEQIQALDQRIAELQPEMQAELAQQAAAQEEEPGAGSADAAEASPAEVGGAGPADAAEAAAQQQSAQDAAQAHERVFELAQQKLRLADKAGSIEAEALRADPAVQEAWDRYNTTAAKLNRLESQVDAKLRENEAIAQAQDRLERLEREYETLLIQYEGARAAYRATIAEQERQEDYRRRNAWPGDDWYLWQRLNRRGR